MINDDVLMWCIQSNLYFSGNFGLAIVDGRIYTHAIDVFHCDFCYIEYAWEWNWRETRIVQEALHFNTKF